MTDLQKNSVIEYIAQFTTKQKQDRLNGNYKSSNNVMSLVLINMELKKKGIHCDTDFISKVYWISQELDK